MKRRSFIFQSGSAAAALVVSSGVVGSLAGCKSASVVQNKIFPASPGLSQSPLPYDYKALEPAIDALTMEIHYTRHAAGYAKNLAEAIAAETPGNSTRLESIFENMGRYTTKMRNNAGGHYNHERFWKWMTPGGGNDKTSVMDAIHRKFNTMDAFTKQFNEAAATRFGSGWAWLVVNAQGELQIGSTPNQDNPLMSTSEFRGFPILGLDVWEHAYYLKYQNKRADYINAWWKVVNWKEVDAGYRFATNA